MRQDYDHDAWLEAVSEVEGFENMGEDSPRCSKCFDFNLKAAYEKARQLGIDSFTTTLTVSRFKSSLHVFEVGRQYNGFEAIDFKKKDGFARSCAMAKELGLYRQSYCGCEFSKKEHEEVGNA